MDTIEQSESSSYQPEGTQQPPSVRSRTQIKEAAKASFKSHYWIGVALSVVVLLIAAVTNPMMYEPSSWRMTAQHVPPSSLALWITFLVGLLIMPLLGVGQAWSFLRIYRNEKAEVENLFAGFKNYGHNLGGMLWMYLFTTLWTCLFIIPGIIKAIAYSFTPYLLQEYPDLGATEALKVSMKMTRGHKGEMFVMYLSFIGWELLSCLTLGILGIFYVNPYLMTSMAGLYEEYKNLALATGVVTPAELH